MDGYDGKLRGGVQEEGKGLGQEKEKGRGGYELCI
jgi:hypothetical protein